MARCRLTVPRVLIVLIASSTVASAQPATAPSGHWEGAIQKDLDGSWEGTLDADGTLLRLTVKLSNQPDGTAAGMLISFDQNGVEIPIAVVVQTDSHLTLHVPSVVGRYEGDFKGGELTGRWTQGPKTWPLVFKRSK
jgi:hypothetical protein